MFEDEWNADALPVPALTPTDLLDAPDDSAAWLAATPPGADAVAGIQQLDPSQLSAAGRVDLLLALERQLSWLAGVQANLLAAMAAAGPDGRAPRI